ncbi:response regulator transcription factor [Aridibaculum aurantiacum]|uniref:response regulator transcription factor n=1 Tax=Aridibaculum aurantiacum TaxID=2810307 RepID=UPI001A97629F|nr:response regulator transcription factor [Aridibaculum aurantiacum]
MPTLIAFAEDNAINRKTFISKVSQYPELSLVITALDGADFLEQLKGLPHHLHPQVVFMDLEMPQMEGIQTIRIAKALYPAIHFIVLTVFDDEDKIFEAIRAGASGYLLKHEKAEAIKNAVENVLVDGGVPMSPAIARKAMEMLSKAQPFHQTATTTASEVDIILSAREKEILQHTIQGLDAKRIASLLGLSVNTVRKHTANIYARLHVNSKAQVMHLAHELKWFH